MLFLILIKKNCLEITTDLLVFQIRLHIYPIPSSTGPGLAKLNIAGRSLLRTLSDITEEGNAGYPAPTWSLLLVEGRIRSRYGRAFLHSSKRSR